MARCTYRRYKHEDYVRMLNGGLLTNMINRRIGSKLYQVCLNISI